jgi:hypothetical protein
MDASFTHNIHQVSIAENEILTTPFSIDDVHEAVFHIEHNKASEPDGFPTEFSQVFWDFIKGDLMLLFMDLHNNTLPMHSLNFGVITLTPMKYNAIKVKEYRPICLLNVSFKTITKVLTNIIGMVVDRIIKHSHTTFMAARNILEGVIMLHETIHELHKKNLDGIILNWTLRKPMVNSNGISFNKQCA